MFAQRQEAAARAAFWFSYICIHLQLLWLVEGDILFLHEPRKVSRRPEGDINQRVNAACALLALGVKWRMDKKKTRPAKAAAISSADHKALFKDINDHAKIMGPQLANWLEDAVRVTQLVAGGNRELIPVFWIRLFGVLHEINELVSRQRSFLAPQNDPAFGLDAVAEAIAILANVFSEDELIWLEYRRNVECHVFQDNYRLLKNNRPSKKVVHKLVKRDKDVAATDEALSRVLQRYDAEHLIALDFAKRAAIPLAQVQHAAVPWCGVGR